MSPATTPRLWIGPDGQMLDCDAVDRSHSMAVVENPDFFSLSHIADLLATMAESDDFDFDHVIALAEDAGWTRVSRDAGEGMAIAVSSASAASAAGAMRHVLSKYGISSEVLDVEISDIEGSTLTQRYHHIEHRAVRAFLRRGILPSPVHIHQRSIAA